jgi:hypothetical protein
MSIPDFIARCDRYCAASGRGRVWLSKRLFDDTNRLEVLAGGKSDVGVKRLERASRDLAALEEALAALPANDQTASQEAA